MLDLFLCNELGGFFRILAWPLYLLALIVLVLAPWWHALLVFIFALGLHIWGSYLQFSSAHTVAIKRRPW